MFALSKWYLDCVSSEGEAFIGYSAELSWGERRLSYVGRVNGPSSLTRESPPRLTDQAVEWESEALGVRGAWTGSDPLPEVSLFEGAVLWQVLRPCARVVLQGEMEGWGYAEKVRLGRIPWKLDIGQLRWGRFTSPSSWLVWVGWSGGLLVYRDGAAQTEARLEPDGLSWPGGKLTVERGTVLRQGPLARTVPVLSSLVPAALREQKWISRGWLDGQPGWVIHEVVHFPRRRKARVAQKSGS